MGERTLSTHSQRRRVTELMLMALRVPLARCRQWYDEIRKWAPKLNTHVWYADAAKKAKALKELREADVLITTPHMILPNELATKSALRARGDGESRAGLACGAPDALC